MLRLTKPSDDELRRLLEASRRAEVTYAEVGATRAEMPAGYRIDRYERRIGTGEGLFEKAVEVLRAWEAQRGAGVDVFPRDARAVDGSTVLFVLRAFGLWTVAPCRIVYVDERRSRFRFGYGTLPGHAERGAVAMPVSCDGAGIVTARIDSFSRTVDPLARAALPLTRVLQKRVTSGYLDALFAAST
jgi:uncharacterized protein (UPF0548 family)